jgi:release factor glutamine methyltransferase
VDRPGVRVRIVACLPSRTFLIVDQLGRRLRAAGCVFAEEEAELLIGTDLTGASLEALVRRRIGGEPLETLLGWVAFAGRRLLVRPGVFVPRRRTELLARTAGEHARPDAVLLELCCGVGPVGATVRAAEIHLGDVDPAALECARVNVPSGQVHLSDLYADLPATLRGRVNVLAANAPYVPSDQVALMPSEARDHEPGLALDGGPDGVDLHRRIAAQAMDWLSTNGVLVIETSVSQASLTAGAMHEAGFSSDVLTDPEIGACVVVGRRPST